MLPFEFIIEGPPVSLQTRNRARLRGWKTSVANAATAVLAPGLAPVISNVSIVITYYHDGPRPDLDNIIKPIQDALCGIIFQDDAQVLDTRSRSRELGGSYVVKGASRIVVGGILDGKDFLHIKIEEHIRSAELE